MMNDHSPFSSPREHSYTAAAPEYYDEVQPDLDIKRVKKLITARPVKGGLALRIGSKTKLAAHHQFGARKATQRRGGSKA